MGVSVIQPSFASGELAPSLYARVDLARYQTGLRLCRNFYVMPYGGIKNRPGTKYLGSTKSDGVARLIPFEFNDEQTYALEFGNLYMRVIKDGGYVESSPGVPYEIVTPYTAAQLFELNFTQSADVMTIVHPSHAPRDLSRLDHDNWTLAVISFVPTLAAPATVTAANTGGTGTTQSWQYQVTAVVDSGTGSIEESLATSSNIISVFSSSLQATLNWTAVVGATYYNVYKDNAGAGVFGFIGRSSTVGFSDNNISPVKTDTPPSGFNPFVGVNNYPGAVGYYQQRRCFAGSNNNPQTVWMSKTGAFKNFGYSTPLKDDDSIIFTVASKQVHRFRHLLPLRQLLGLTTGGEWVMGGGEAGLTPKNIQAEIQSYNGSSRVPPIVVNSSAIYLQARQSVVSSLAYTFESDGFSGEDLTKFSSHFFRGYQILDWSYQQVPDRIVWAVRDDGALLGMTFLPEEQLVAWHQHSTDGFFESVCCIAEGEEDALYAVVRRTIDGVQRRYVERMASRRISDIEDAFFVDCGLTYDGRNGVPANFMTLSGGTTWGYPELITMTATGHAPFSGVFIGRTYRLRSGSNTVRVEVISVTSPTVVTVKLQEICPGPLRDAATADWALMAETIFGLSHLEGKTVSILADGDVHPQRAVLAGSVTLQSPAAVVQVGLPYLAEAETLDIDIAGGETLLDKRKAIPSVTFYLETSRNLWAGPDASRIYETKAPYRQRYNQPVSLETGTTQLSVPTNWSNSGRVYVQQPDPLPLTILAIIPDVVIGGKG